MLNGIPGIMLVIGAELEGDTNGEATFTWLVLSDFLSEEIDYTASYVLVSWNWETDLCISWSMLVSLPARIQETAEFL
jgi:hypothetical protein